ncbi:MAG: hypothetical protein HC937_02480 [Aquincola sp.]|nr:hypothetical protein [Aquincola sp.]
MRNEALSAQARLDAIDTRITEGIALLETKFAASVRETLVDEPVGIRKLFTSVADLSLQGHEQERLLQQLNALRELHSNQAAELPRDFDTS